MSDLISRSKAISVLEQLEEHSLTGKVDISNAIYLLENQPIVYDIDKTVEELEGFAKLAEDRWVNGTSEHAYQEHKCWVKAIEIVKQGVVSDDVCGWKLEDDNLMTGCGDYFNLYDNCTDKFKFCPTCGKKIKVAE